MTEVEGSLFTTKDRARFDVRDDLPPTVHSRWNGTTGRWETPVDFQATSPIGKDAAQIVRDFQTVADATYLATKSRIDGGEDGLELPLAVAMGMAHQARQILQAINAKQVQS